MMAIPISQNSHSRRITRRDFLKLSGSSLGPMRSESGVVFQSPALLPWLTARENLLLAVEQVKDRRKERKQLAEKFLSLVGLSDIADCYPDEPSPVCGNGEVLRRRSLLNRSFFCSTSLQSFGCHHPYGAAG